MPQNSPVGTRPRRAFGVEGTSSSPLRLTSASHHRAAQFEHGGVYRWSTRCSASGEFLGQCVTSERLSAGRRSGVDEPACRPDSVEALTRPRRPSICGRRRRRHPATYPRTRKSSPRTPAQARRTGPSWSCSGWGLPSRPGHPGRWWSLTPPFHPCPHLDIAEAVGGLSLWHFPAGRPGWVLPTTLLCGVRTFLDAARDAATVRPARPPRRSVARDPRSPAPANCTGSSFTRPPGLRLVGERAK